jgi:hypothetical protein
VLGRICPLTIVRHFGIEPNSVLRIFGESPARRRGLADGSTWLIGRDHRCGMDVPGGRALWLETGRDRQARVGPRLRDRTILTTRRPGEPELTIGDRRVTAVLGFLCAFVTRRTVPAWS